MAIPCKKNLVIGFTFMWGNFSILYKLLKKYDIDQVDGILADFGTSQIQIAQTPGISLFRDTPLDMRLSAAHQQVTAADILNKASEEKFAQIFFQLGEEAKRQADCACDCGSAKQRNFTTTGQLVDFIETIIPNGAHEVFIRQLKCSKHCAFMLIMSLIIFRHFCRQPLKH